MEKPSLQSNTAKDKVEKMPFFSTVFVKLIVAFVLIAFSPYVLILSLLVSGYEPLVQKSMELLARQQRDALLLLVQLKDLHLKIALVGGTVGFIMVAMSWGISSHFSRRISRLVRSLRKNDAEIMPLVHPEGDDEIGELGHEVNNMVEKFQLVRERDKELSQAKNQFITIAAHHLRTPLTALRWSLSRLRDESVSEQERQGIIQRDLEVIEQSVYLVGNLLNVVRIEEGRFGFEFEKADIIALIEKAMQGFVNTAHARKLTLNFKPPSGIPSVLLDVNGITIVLNSLISNAVNYTPEGGEITVSCRFDPGQKMIEVEVKDTGIGIAPGEIGHIFGQFFRTENAKRFQPNGTGIGLFLAKSIVERHGGTINVSSEEGKGSIFTFAIPLERQETAPAGVGFEKFFEGLGGESPTHSAHAGGGDKLL